MRMRLMFVCLLTLIAASVAAQQISLGSLFDRYEVNPKWAQLPAGQAWGASTSWVDADGKGTVAVLVRQAPYVRLFTTDGTPVASWGDARLFTLAHSVHFDPDGSIWVVDPNAHAAFKFDRKGTLLQTIGTKGTRGDNESRTAFNEPNALTVTAGGDIFVSDGYGNSRVVQVSRDGTFVRIFGGRKGSGPGELDTPHGVAVDAQGRVLVSDSGNKRVSIFNADGTFVKTVAAPSRGGLAVAADGTIFVSDVNAGAITVLRDDRIADVIKVDGRPHGLTLDPTTGDLYTSSTLAKQWNVTKASPKSAVAPPTR